MAWALLAAKLKAPIFFKENGNEKYDSHKGLPEMGLAKLRKEAGLTLHQLAAKSGVNYMKIHQIEKGKIKVEHIMLRTAQRLANALGCEPKDLLTPDD